MNAKAAAASGGRFAVAYWPVLIMRLLFPAIPVAGIVYGIVRIQLGDDGDRSGRAVIFGSVVLVLIFLALELARPGDQDARTVKNWPYGWTTVLFGADGRMSTSKTQVWLWTLGLAYAAAYLTGVTVFVHSGSQVFENANWEDYLVLLGGPFAAAVIAKYAVTTKVNNGTLDKSPTSNADPNTLPSDKAGPGDIVSKDDGSVDVVDSQYLVFNIVAFGYAAGVFISHNFNHGISIAAGKYTLPNIPAVLLALTSASAATYVGNKGVQKNAPGISSVSDAKPGQTVTITGVNLVPPGTPPANAVEQTWIWITGPDGVTHWEKAQMATPTLVKFFMPPAYANQHVEVVEVSGGAIPTPAYPVVVASA